jgi:glycosyltransferase involved in cell wall biosynthesis
VPNEPRRLAVLADFTEEGWPSMYLCAEMLLAHLPDKTVSANLLRPPFRRLATRLPLPRRKALNADRLLNRFRHFPRFAKKHAGEFDVFHIADHTYAQLVHVLPAARTGVYCHDLDAFRCLIEPKRDPRPSWFRELARRVLTGLQKAAVVFHSTHVVRAEIERHGLVDSARLVRAPYGVCPEFAPDGPAAKEPSPFLLHVGSNSPRKRIDLLLRTLAGVLREFPAVRLVKVGEPFPPEQQALIAELDIQSAVVGRENLGRDEIASLYRSAAAVLLPSDAEGFGLPVIEALACGAAVFASDLPVLREVGGDAATYLPPGDVEAWVAGVSRALSDSHHLPPRSTRLKRAAHFSWVEHARVIRDAYRRLAR